MGRPFFIGPYESGLVTAVKPWMLPEDAFAWLRNAYVWRGTVRKRVGSRLLTGSGVTEELQQLYSRLRIQINTTNGVGNCTEATGPIPGVITGNDCIGQIFSIGNEIFTVRATGSPVNLLHTGPATVAQYNTTTLAYTFNGAAAFTAVYWYPSLPVMGFINMEVMEISNEPIIAFDTKFSYNRVGNGWARLGTLVWNGSDSQFFWGANYRGATNDEYYLFVVNNNRADQICYWNTTTATWIRTTFQTRHGAPNYQLQSARLIVSFKNRLLALNTLEMTNGVDSSYFNRVRWCMNGDPTAADAWYDNIAGKGGWLEAPTKEAIITAAIFKDRLIVYFEKSTWELVYTGNEVLPFVWQTIDIALGAESTFSVVLLDRGVLAVGQSGIHACNGLNVVRIDERIPDEVFNIHNENAGIERVAGIRDYSNEMVYWTFPNSLHNTTYPDRILAYNYRNNTWSFFDDSITVFGYYQNVIDITWEMITWTWAEWISLWGCGSIQSQHKNVIAGNQVGFTFLIDSYATCNAPSLQITDIDISAFPSVWLTVKSHNIVIDESCDVIQIEYVQGIININNRIYRVEETALDPVTGVTKLKIIGDPENVMAGIYAGGGVITRISIIDIYTKQFNFYQDSKRMAIERVEFDVDKTDSGTLKVEYLPSTSSLSIGKISATDPTSLEPFILETYPYDLYPFEETQNRLVRRIFIGSEGDCIQLRFYTDYTNYTVDFGNAQSNFVLNSMTFYASTTASR
jgi:hypothetical protein